MRTSFDIPFYATELPCPLPSTDEIENSTDRISLAYGGRRIVGVGQHFVVKFGLQVNLMEGENMLFVRENTNIPVPRVYALYSDSSTGKNYIVMERIIGHSLLSVWPQLGTLEQRRIQSDLQRYFDELRQLPSPGYFGSFGNRPLLDRIFWTREPDPLVNGPFDSEEDLNTGMIRKYTMNPGGSVYRAHYLRQFFPCVLKGHEAVFTHGDLQRKNIMIRERNNQTNDDASLVIINWENSGWYPQYWEWFLAVCALRYDDDWPICIGSILTPFVAEAALLQSLRPELWS